MKRGKDIFVFFFNTLSSWMGIFFLGNSDHFSLEKEKEASVLSHSTFGFGMETNECQNTFLQILVTMFSLRTSKIQIG